MGINFILPLIAGIVMTVILGTQVAPSLVENMKIKKVENRTISNQNLIKDAIVRYIKMTGLVPKDLNDLKKYELLKDHHETNLFGGGYSFTIDKKKGILKIFTTIDDEGAGKYFSNSFKFPNVPTCKQALDSNGVCVSGKFETFYLLDEDTFKSIPIPEVGSIEDIKDRFTNVEEVGKKYDETTLVGGEKDYIVDIPNNKVIEYVYDKNKNEWVQGPTIENIGGFGKDTNVFISDLDIRYHTWNETEKKLVPATYKHEKVHCEDTTLLNKEVFVINENTKLGELVWVAPSTSSVSAIQTKIFTNNYIPNNICTSNVSSMLNLFHYKTNFNLPLNRWDVSNVTNMNGMFNNTSKFNQDISSWDVSNILDMSLMFCLATDFNNGDNIGQSNRPLNWDVSNVTNMSSMFLKAGKFNQALNNWDVSNVTDMRNMFTGTTNFNQALNNWNVSNVTSISQMFRNATKFNQDISSWIVSNVTNMSQMFYQATNFNNGDNIGQSNRPLNWDVSNVVTMWAMFSEASHFNQALNDWNVSKVTNMSQMFEYATKFNQDLSGWCVNNIPSTPTYFNLNTPAWSKTLNADGKIALQPQWGTCPNP